MFSGSMTLEVTREYVHNQGQNKSSVFQSVYDPELFIILRRTSQINVTDITRTKYFTLTGTFQKATEDELMPLETQP